MSVQRELSGIPYIGCGIGLRFEASAETLKHRDEIDVLEIISENFFPNRPLSQTLLDEALKRFPIVCHGIDLSIGSAVPWDDTFLKNVKDMTHRVKAHYYSDHFCICKHDDLLDIGHLSPLWYTKEMLEHVVRRVDFLQQYLGLPVVLENITRPFVIPEADYEEPEFIAEVCRRTGCGLLLDVTNVFINAHNEKKDAQKLVERYPMEYVVHIHLAGGTAHADHLHDTHSHELTGAFEGVWPLLEWVAHNADIKTLIIERDEEFKPDFEEMILRDLRRARGIVESAQAAKQMSAA